MRSDKVFKWFLGIVSLLVFSPLFYLLAHQWKLVGRKPLIFLSLLLPLFLVINLLFYLLLYCLYDAYEYKHMFTDNDVVSEITGAPIPEFDLVEYNEGYIAFGHSKLDELIVEFNEMPDEELFVMLDSLTVTDSGWEKSRDDTYSFTVRGGDWRNVPKGVDDYLTFTIYITKGDKRAVIIKGVW